jgi:LPXTG-motif cell wall-anchored protein
MKQSSALFVVVFVVSLLIGVQAVEVANANPMYMKPYYEIFSIQSPQNNNHYTNPIPLKITLVRNAVTIARSYYYTIDLGAPQKISQLEIVKQQKITSNNYDPYTEVTLDASIVLSFLDEGWHNITVGSATVRFYVNASAMPTNPTPNITPVPSLLPSVSPSNSPTINPNRAFQEKLVAIQQSYTLVIISIAVIIGLGVLFYFRRRKKKP